MIYSANILKMYSSYEEEDAIVQYYLPLGEETIHMNPLIGKNLRIEFLHEINCIKCGRTTKKSYGQGFCYPCFKTAPEADPAIIKPELDQAHLGIARDMEWAKKYSLTEHCVYLALSSGVKVGVTRSANLPHRWIDQGASRAVRLAITPYRNLAGLIEVALKAHFADKTNWRRMLTNNIDDGEDLGEHKRKALEYLPEELKEYYTDDNRITELKYPVLEYPAKVKSLGLDKQETVEGTLTGIKGQYLYFEGGNVFNIRKHNGYSVEIRTA